MSAPRRSRARLALMAGPRGDRRRAGRRRAGLGLALVVLAVAAVLVARGTIRLPGAAAARIGPERQAPGHAAAAEARTATPPRAAARAAPEARPARDRVVAPTHAAALFAQHSWYVLPPAPPPPPPPPPPPATAPPFPYAFVGSYAPQGQAPVFFLSHGDRVIDARVGDRLDGVYQFESAAGGQLVFVYLPLDVRQSLPVGASK